MDGESRVRGVSAVTLIAATSALAASAALSACSDDATCSEAKAMSSSAAIGGWQPLAPDSLRLIAVGDTGEGNLAQALVARMMDQKCAAVGGCDAVIMTGDNFYEDGVEDLTDEQFSTKFEEPYALPHLENDRTGAALPFYVVLGNHDLHSDWRPQVAYTMLPIGDEIGTRKTARWTMPNRWYDVRLRSVHLFAFDSTQYAEPVQAPEMAAKVMASDAPWKIAFSHHPRFTSGAHYFDNPDLGNAGMYALQEAIYCGTDLFISGHDHDTEFIEKGRDPNCPNTHFLVTGAGSKVRASRAPRDAKSVYFDDQAEAFAYLEITEQRMHVEFIDMCGNTRFERDITR
jgi:hypothetical protein